VKPIAVPREQVIAYRARMNQLDERLPLERCADAAHNGLQDSVPRGGVVSLHARVSGAQPDSWEHPDLAQIWFRGGADYIVPRRDVGLFTLGSQPRDANLVAQMDGLAQAVHDYCAGRVLPVREVTEGLGIERPLSIRSTAMTGRVLIRWNASNIWLVPIERPEVDAEDARLELARRFMTWFAPQTKKAMARWIGLLPGDASATWKAIEDEFVAVEVDGTPRGYVRECDLDALRTAEPVSGVRLIPQDDPYVKLDTDLAIPDPRPIGKGFIVNWVLIDNEIAGIWQRQQRKISIEPWRKLTEAERDAIEQEARTLPIAGEREPQVTWL
jgi:hypothetical protein